MLSVHDVQNASKFVWILTSAIPIDSPETWNCYLEANCSKHLWLNQFVTVFKVLPYEVGRYIASNELGIKISKLYGQFEKIILPQRGLTDWQRLDEIFNTEYQQMEKLLTYVFLTKVHSNVMSYSEFHKKCIQTLYSSKII